MVRRSRAGQLRGLKTYLSASLIANLAWEILQLPLYALWTTGTSREIAFAVVHCTLGDALIALASLTLALIVAGTKGWPVTRFKSVLLLTVATGVAYTVFSEWLNLVVRSNWSYSKLMPVVPVINTGLSPLLQWVVIPILALLVARRLAVSNRSK